MSSASDKTKLFAKNISKDCNVNELVISLPFFSSRTNMKLYNKQVIKFLDSSKTSGPDCIPVVVLENCEPELS